MDKEIRPKVLDVRKLKDDKVILTDTYSWKDFKELKKQFAKFLQDTISADMLYHPSNLKKHFESKITALTGKLEEGK